MTTGLRQLLPVVFLFLKILKDYNAFSNNSVNNLFESPTARTNGHCSANNLFESPTARNLSNLYKSNKLL